MSICLYQLGSLLRLQKLYSKCFIEKRFKFTQGSGFCESAYGNDSLPSVKYFQQIAILIIIDIKLVCAVQVSKHYLSFLHFLKKNVPSLNYMDFT